MMGANCHTRSRHFRRTNMLVYCSLLAIYFCTVNCATLTNSSENEDVTDIGSNNQENKTFAHRKLFQTEQILANNPVNPYLHPASFGFPIYQTQQQFTPPIHYDRKRPISNNGDASLKPLAQQQKKRIKVKLTDEDSLKVPLDSTDIEEKEVTKTKHKKEKRKKEKPKKEVNSLEKVESKTVEDEGTERGCPACVGGTCDSLFDPSTNISGIPVIQILIALVVGAFWAAIFAFILHNFIEYKDEGGYGYGPPPTPQYGAPTSQYGAPTSQYGAPASEYGAPTGYGSSSRISFGNGYGRSSRGFTFNDLSNRVWDAIDKFISKYDD